MTEYVMIDKGALQMVINALRRDAEEGRAARGEMAGILAAAPQQAAEPVNEGRLRSIVRQAMLRANTNYQAGGGYERYLAMLDADAANFAQQISDLYAAHPPAQPNPWAPNRFEYDRSIHSNPDAKAWADLFVQTFPGLADKHDLMVTWFANAMMAMHDHLQRKSAQPAPIPTSERLPTEADGDCYGNVWWWNTKKETWILLAWSASLDDRCWPHWLPTGLTRPAAPDSECHTCNGSGHAQDQSGEACTICHGTGTAAPDSGDVR